MALSASSIKNGVQSFNIKDHFTRGHNNFRDNKMGRRENRLRTIGVKCC